MPSKPKTRNGKTAKPAETFSVAFQRYDVNGKPIGTSDPNTYPVTADGAIRFAIDYGVSIANQNRANTAAIMARIGDVEGQIRAIYGWNADANTKLSSLAATQADHRTRITALESRDPYAGTSIDVLALANRVATLEKPDPLDAANKRIAELEAQLAAVKAAIGGTDA